LYENICFIKQATLLAIISIWGGVDSSILWLSFAQQKSSENKAPGGVRVMWAGRSNVAILNDESIMLIRTKQPT
jgi:hypothetical protein